MISLFLEDGMFGPYFGRKLIAGAILSLILSFGWFAFGDDPISKQENKKVIAYMDNVLTVAKEQQYELIRIENIIKENSRLSEGERIALALCIQAMAQKYPNLNLELICAVITWESGWKSYALSKAGAHGLMQVMPATGQEVAGDIGLDHKDIRQVLRDPIQNIVIGCHYLSELLSTFDGDIELALAAYNFGPTRIQKGYRWPAQTRKYVPGIVKLASVI